MHVQVAAQVADLDEPRRHEAGRELAAVLAQLGRRDTSGRGARRPPPRSRSAASRRSRRRGSRTRETCSPRRTAASRSATLCAVEPVKCCRRLPKLSGSTTRRSTGRPVCVRPRAAFSLGADADSMRSSSPSARTSAPGSVAVAMMSRSLTRVGLAARRAGELDALGGRVRAQRRDDLLADRQRAVQQRRAAPAARRCRRRATTAPTPRTSGRSP